MDEPKDLTALTQTYPDPSRGIRALVLREYEKIQAARRRGWTWPEIAAALGKTGQARSVSTAFSRVKKRVLAGDLEPAKSQPGKAATTRAQTKATAVTDTGASVVDPDTGFRTPAAQGQSEGDDAGKGKWL
jgi:hypothetical protein